PRWPSPTPGWWVWRVGAGWCGAREGSPAAVRLPTTLVITDEADVLRDEGEQYANKLREAGVDVTSVRVAGMVHDFLLLDSLRDTRAANVARKLAVDALRTALHES
ncbi:alpha/beta hydrolase, partial [Streptomyces sp. NPDC001940]